MKLLVCDVDGVLNDHAQMLNLYCGIQKDKIELLNQIIARTGCKIVISSAWRYMIHMGEMTYRGFEYMLLTHGLVAPKDVIVGATRTDQVITTRGEQITDWLKRTEYKVENYVVVDDLELDIRTAGHYLVQTDGKIGLTAVNVEEIVRRLNGI